MLIHLVAADDSFRTLCQGVLSNLPDVARGVVLEALDEDDGECCEADIHIWNYRAGLLPAPESINWSSLRHLCLLDRNELAAFQEKAGTAADGAVLLKPVGPGTLATFLVAAIAAAEVKSLREDRDDILQCLIETNLKLQQYDYQRTAFLSRAIHDFRAPLTALRGYCDVLLSGPLGSLTEVQAEVLRRMQNSATRLSRMTSAMYELSAGRNTERRPDLQPGDLGECVQQTLYEIAPFADDKSISITTFLEPSDDLYFESGLIQQALVNILDNACRFTPRAGSIEIRGYPYFWERRKGGRQLPMERDRRVYPSREPNSYRIEVANSGAPIPEEHLATIFEEYTSCPENCDRSGGGLGLAICKKIITQHHGRIWAENRDGGPVFSFVLPLSRMDPRFPVPGDCVAAGVGGQRLRNAD